MKRAISIFTGLFIFLLTTNTVSANVIGDINGDGTVGLAEALFSLQVAAGLHPGFPDACVLTGVGIWETGVNYMECDVVSHGDNFYVALVANTSVAENAPNVDSTIWAPLPLEGEPGPIAGIDKQFAYNDNGSGAGAEVYYDNTTSSVGIGTNTPEFKLTLDNDGGIIAKGTFDYGAKLATSGSGPRLIWYPRKAAFRAGYAHLDKWDDANIGIYSTAMGGETTASGLISTAMGGETTASGAYSTAMGYGTTASDTISTAMGTGTTASGYSSTAMGYGTTASGEYSTAIGYGTTASGNYSTTMGAYTTASGFVSTAMGANTTASGEYSTAMGTDTIASGKASTAMGALTTASGDGSTVIGKGYYADRLENNHPDSFMVGYMNSETDTEPELFVQDGGVGIGTADPGNLLAVSGMGAEIGGVAGYNEVVARFLNTVASAHSAISIDALSGQDSILYFAQEGTRIWDLRNDVSTGDKFELRYSGSRVLTVDTSGNVGIGTYTPAGRLDVNGAIYQRGTELHADYVFAPDYELESIDEHATYMWREKHLKAVPGLQYDENGLEVLEVGSRSRGILEELEKAHIYIGQLNDTIKSQQAMIVSLQDVVCQMRPGARICVK